MTNRDKTTNTVRQTITACPICGGSLHAAEVREVYLRVPKVDWLGGAKLEVGDCQVTHVLAEDTTDLKIACENDHTALEIADKLVLMDQEPKRSKSQRREACEVCDGDGFLVSNPGGRLFHLSIERCDACAFYDSDQQVIECEDHQVLIMRMQEALERGLILLQERARRG